MAWIDRALAEGSRRVDEVEVFYALGVSVSGDLKRQNINIANRSNDCGLGIRTIDKGRIGVSSTHNPKRWRECLRSAIASGRLATPQAWDGLPESQVQEHEEMCYDPSLAIDPPAASGLLRQMLEGASQHPAKVTSGSASLSSTTITIANSHGVRYTSCHTGVSVSLEAISNQSTGYEFAQSCFMDIDPFSVGEKASSLAVQSEKGQDIRSGSYDVLLSPVAFAELLAAAFVPALSGRNVHAGRSRLAGRIGETVTDTGLAIYDDPFRKKGLGSSFWDAEGVPTKRTDFIKNGVLSSFAYDLRTAYRYGKKSTGNATRNGFGGAPAIGHHNLVVDGPGTDVALERVIYVNGVVGAHTANPMSGDFSVELSNAFWMEDGEFDIPIRSAMLSGNVFDMLNSVGGISREMRQIGSLVLPSIRLREQRVIGK